MITNLCILLYITPLFALRIGFDISGSNVTSVETFKCILGTKDYKFFLVDFSDRNGHLNEAAIQTIINAEQAKITDIDVVLSPCDSCGNPSDMLISTLNAVSRTGVKIGRVWINVADADQYSYNAVQNVALISRMISMIESHGFKAGIKINHDWIVLTGIPHYMGSNHHERQIMASSLDGWTGFSHLPMLWEGYMSKNNVRDSFNTPIGGWTRAAVLQDVMYQEKKCGISFNNNYKDE